MLAQEKKKEVCAHLQKHKGNAREKVTKFLH